MPLIKGNSSAVKAQNIREFHAGKTYAHTAAKFGKKRADAQAVAVAMETARRYGKKYAEGGDVDPYETKLSSRDEDRFTEWKRRNAPKDSGADYDLRGAFKAGLTPAANGHWPDTFKKPNHPTFSDQSIYAKQQPELAGSWNGETFIPPAMYAEGGLTDGDSWSPEDDANEPISPEVTTVPKSKPRFEEGVLAALGKKPEKVSPTGPYQPELRASPAPSARQRLAQWAMGEEPTPYRRRLTSELLGTTGIGDSGMGLVDATPLGMGLGADEAAHKGHMAEAVANLIPGAPIGKGIGRAVMGAAEHAIPTPQFKYGTPEWEEHLFGEINKVLQPSAGKNAAPELNQSLNELYHGITGKEIPKDSPIAPAPKQEQWPLEDWANPSVKPEPRPAPDDWFESYPGQSHEPPYERPTPSKDDYIGAGAFEKVGPQKGSNPGGIYQDPKTGEQWYVKVPKSQDHADNEILAARLYELAGVPVPEIRPTMIEGQPAIASKIVDGPQLGKMGYGLNVKNSIAKDMPIDAWLANWDAIGTGKDNIIMGETGPHRIDMGGSLRYRAQGDPKGDKFGPDVPELKTFLDPKINKDAADIFGGVDKELTGGAITRLESITPTQIADLVYKWGPRGEEGKEALIDTLLKRKRAVIDDFYKNQQSNLPPITAASTPHKTDAIDHLGAFEDKGDAHNYADYLVGLARDHPEDMLQAKNSLSPAFKKEVNKALWGMTKGADPETKAIINNLYSGKVKAQAKAAGMSDKDYLASLKQKKEAYKSSQEKSDAEWAKEQAEYEGNQSAKEIHEEKINTGDYASESDKKINPEFKSEPQTEARFKEVARPIKDWRDWTPPEYEPELKAVGYNSKPIPRPKGPFNFPNAMHPDALKEWGYNTKVPLYKGGYETWHSELFDPVTVTKDEKAWFAAHHPEVAKAYGSVHTYFAKPSKVIELNWPEFTGYYHYSPHSMATAIKLAHKEGADLLVLHNMVDMAGHKWGGEPHTQFAVLNTKGVRSIDAKFDPTQLHLRHSHAGLVGGGLLGYGLLGQKDQEDGMKNGGRTPMAAGGFNSAKWIPRPPNLMGGIRPVGGGMLRAIAPKASPGLIHSTIPGRTDKIPRSVPGGSYIIPASVVSGMGQGNTLAGADALNKLFAQGPYGDKMQKFGTPKPNFGHPMHMAAPQMRMPKPAKAGGVEEGSDHVPIIVAGGEYQVPPEVVQRLGNGNMKQGHKILDELVMHIRRQTIKDMRNEKKPKGSGG